MTATPPTDDQSNDRRATTGRRTWLQTLALSMILGGTGTAASSVGVDTTRAARVATWEDNADDRIQNNRVGTLDVTVEDSNGNTVSDADVDVTQVEHEFDFGTAVNADNWVDYSPGDRYRTLITDLFNAAQCENHNKWRWWEENNDSGGNPTDVDKNQMLETVNWLLDKGLDMHGHAAIWGSSNFSLPPRIQDELDKNDPDEAYLDSEVTERIETAVGYTNGTDAFKQWNVKNEPTHVKELMSALDGYVSPSPETDWFETAEAADGTASLWTNDYSVIEDGGSQDYEDFIKSLLDDSAPLDGVGFQCHFDGGTVSASSIKSTLDDFAALGDLDLQITEYDDYGLSDSEAPGFFYKILKVVYSHADATGFHVWGFTDASHWKDDAPFFDGSFNPKDTFYEFLKLRFGQWWTSAKGTTDSSGLYSQDVHLGEVEVRADDGSNEGRASTVVSGTGTTSITVTLDGSTSGWNATDTIQAEHYDAQSGTTDDGDQVSGIDDGDYLRYDDVDFSGGADRVELMVGTGNPGNSIEVRLGGTSGTLLATIAPIDTNGTGNKVRQSQPISTSVSGTHDVYLVGSGGSSVGAVDYFRFQQRSDFGYEAVNGDFESGSLSSSSFTQSGGGTAGVSSTTSRSGTYAAYHDGPDSGGIELASTIDTNGFGSVTVDYWAQAGDSTESPDQSNGEDLYVEYKNSAGNWIEVDRIDTYSAEETFDRSVDIPDDDAIHDAFNVRIQRASSSGSDRWYVDDVIVHGIQGDATDSGNDSTAPTAPSNLSSPGHTDTTVELDWDASSDSGGSGLDHYNVYVDGSKDSEVDSSSTATTVTGLSTNTSYDFSVSAVDGAGNESSASSTVSVSTDVLQPVHRWTFDGTSFSDAVGSVSGTMNGGITTGVSGKDGDAWSFDGTDDYVAVSSEGTDLEDGFSTRSFAFWIEPDSTSGTQTVYEEGGSWNGIAVRIDGDTLEAEAETGDDTEYSAVVSTSFTATSWTHVVVTFDNGSLALYVDDSQADSYSASFSSVAAHENDAGIGATNAGDAFGAGTTGNYYGGALDDLRVYDVAMTNSQVSNLYSSYESSGDSTAPTAPSNLSSPGKTASSVDLDWDASSDSGGSGLDHYNVYVDGAKDHEVAAGTTSTTVTSLSSNTSYDFYVTAVDGAGNESSASGTVTVTTDSAPSPVSRWTLDGTSATDSAGSNDGTMNGSPTTGVTGKDGDAWSFDGSDDRIEVADDTSLDSSNFTVSCWLKTSNLNSNSQSTLVNKAVYSNKNGYLVMDDGQYGSEVLFRVMGGGSTYDVSVERSTVNDGSWHHIVATKDGSTTTLYVDGTSQDSRSDATVDASSSKFGISGNAGGGNELDGTVDDVRFYDQALTSAEVSGLYNSY